MKVVASRLALRDTDTDRQCMQRRHIVPLEGCQRSNCSLNDSSNKQLYVRCDKSRSNTHSYTPVIDVLLLRYFQRCCRKYSARKHCSVRLPVVYSKTPNKHPSLQLLPVTSFYRQFIVHLANQVDINVEN